MFFKKGVGSGRNIVVLREDNWDDWFQYETKYNVSYFDFSGLRHEIGNVKIGQHPYPDSRKPDIPLEFNELPEGFFSLGQAEYYYESIKLLDQKWGNGLREKVLKGLKDVAFNEQIYRQVVSYNVTQQSLLRDVSETTVEGQFRRIARGGATLTPYDFLYMAGGIDGIPPLEMTFNVDPHTRIPTNIHVMIGRNGVGKTYLMKNMIYSLMGIKDGAYGEFIFDSGSSNITFANIVYVSFSAFDNISEWYSVEKFQGSIPFIPVGLDPTLEDTYDKKGAGSQSSSLEERFADSIELLAGGYKLGLWKKAIKTLETDPIFKQTQVSKVFMKDGKADKERAKELYKKLSSGHKIIMLTITKLVEKVEEKTLVFLDEPEGHLHPPLLASFIRALSELLNNRNGVAIVATHSPVVLQEVPRKCVWKLRRNGRIATAERLVIESFGQSIGELTREVFGLEATNSGYHNILKQVSDEKSSFEEVVDYFENELGIEAMAMIQAMLLSKKAGAK